jgi:hypothetical protein
LSRRILLSDDEVVAAAVRLGKDWKASLPTVNVEDPSDLIRAAARGHRSLYLRGLLTGPDNSELVPEVSALLGPAAGAIPQHLGYAADSANPQVVAGLRFAIFESAHDNKILIVTLPNGINEVSEVHVGAARDFVEAFAAAPLQAGAEDKAVVLITPNGKDSAGFGVVTAEGTTSGAGELSLLDLASGQPTRGVPANLVPSV